MSQLVADYILERLREWGVHRIYGYPGDGINAILGALDRAEGDPELIQVRHEEMAAFMACAHAKFTGEVGVCLATSGPGAIHLLNGLYDAKLDHQPVVAIVGQQARAGARRRLPAGGRPASRCSRTSPTSTCRWRPCPTQIRHLVDRAVRIALAQRTVTCLIVPNDLGTMEAAEPAARARHRPLDASATRAPRIVPGEDSAVRRGARSSTRASASRCSSARARSAPRRR